MGLVKYKEVYKPQENVTQFPVVYKTQLVPVIIKSPTAEPSNRFYLGSFDIFNACYVKAIVAEDTYGASAKYVNGIKIMTLAKMKQAFITLVDYHSKIIVDHIPITAFAPVDNTGAAIGNNGSYFRTHMQIDPEASYVNWSDTSDIGGTFMLMLTFYLQTIKK